MPEHDMQPMSGMASGQPMAGVTARLSRAEQFVAGGALIVFVVNDLVGDLLLRLLGIDGYTFESVIWLLAVAALVAIYLRRWRGVQFAIGYANVLLVLGSLLALAVAHEFIYDLGASFEAIEQVFRVVLYVGGVLAAVGAYFVWSAGESGIS